MNKKLVTAGLVAGLSLAAVADAQACGATMFGTGQGSRFQAYRARVPANVLIYASPQLADSSATTKPAIQDGLRKAGHQVTVVSDADALSAALAERHYDVVIAGAGDAEAVAQRVDGSENPVGIVPVVGGSTGSPFDTERYAQTLKSNAGIGQFLKAINNVMALRAQ